MTELTSPEAPAQPANFAVKKRRMRLLGLTTDDAIKAFFGGNAVIAIVILALITIFLLREGMDFFSQNHENLRIYRWAGLEYVDIIREQERGHTALTRDISALRVNYIAHLQKEKKLSLEAAFAEAAPFDEFSNEFSDAVTPLRGLVSDLSEVASGIKTAYIITQDQRKEQLQLIAAGKPEAAAQVKIVDVDFAEQLKPLVGTLPAYKEMSREFSLTLSKVLDKAPILPSTDLHEDMESLKTRTREYLATFPAAERRLETWDHKVPVPAWRKFTSFLFGRDWLTASSWQDWYGLRPLFVGSLMVSFVALSLAVPFGVGAAIYVNQVAGRREQSIIKPGIEFISAFPSVVLGFFGIAVLGQALRALSEQPWMAWFPGFPFSERLNVLTAGCLLGLMAVPTIFTLAEDALSNVPRALWEASLALGATRLQTTLRIVVPASLSGIISAILLGLGRVIGETMVVLLCAGNRIAIPDFSQGMSVFTEPVHTMTGIIAQEMGEVEHGSIHYRALFVVGLVLFVLSLAINYAAQKIVRRYRISIG